jgi:hypothetical protein
MPPSIGRLLDNDLVIVKQESNWGRLQALVLDSVSSPITRRVYNLGLDEFFAWYEQEPRAGFTKATVSAWRVALEARGLGAVSINVRITAVRKLAVEAADNGLLAPELAQRYHPRESRNSNVLKSTRTCGPPAQFDRQPRSTLERRGALEPCCARVTE